MKVHQDFKGLLKLFGITFEKPSELPKLRQSYRLDRHALEPNPSPTFAFLFSAQLLW